ncbi:MAG: response regulator, partial [Gemmatimonadetes bacterium]|nr:response regulator [Gemmatimonadota bacterium]
VRRAAPDLAILDYRMGTPDGFEVCRQIKTDPGLAWLPVLILTAERGIEDRLGGFGAGADDYLAKPFDTRELMARVAALLRQAARGRDRNPTTGLPGGEALYAEVERRRERGVPFSICYFDLDHFKPFADRFGFAVADAAIREVGIAVAAAGDGPDTFVGHVGGDDFVLLGAPAEARRRAEDAQQRFAAALEGHLPEDAVDAGSYWGRDRYGVERYFPVTRLSAAVLRVDPAKWVSLEHLGERVAELKRDAKQEGGTGIAEADLVP